jgi:DNA-binding NtrC family response regulator
VKGPSRFDIPFAHVRNLIGSTRTTRLLLVEPDPLTRAALSAAGGRSARVDACSSFHSARARLNATAYDLIVTAARLREYNGIHLVYLARNAHEPTNAIVYDEQIDPGFAAEVLRARAFYEVAQRLPVSLSAYIDATLPAMDRRAPAVSDRRLSPRGGRRKWDRHISKDSLDETSGSRAADEG